jgi:asparagine synthase (glutamine-hydrolysing)
LLHLAFHRTPESVHERQPLRDARWALVADVRLDNRDVLLAALRVKTPGAVVTDPEILLHAFARWGRRCVDHLLGDFAFAIWDRRERTLFMARDPLGAYSLSFHRRGDRFVFASETAAILELPEVSGEIDEDSVWRMLATIPPDPEASFFREVRHLAPAHCLLVSPHGEQTWRYWQPDAEHRLTYRSDDEYTEHLLELLHRATAARMRSIGPVGVSLSGGNDSTLIAACAARQLSAADGKQSHLKSVSNVFTEHAACDERRYIDPVVARYALDASFVPSDGLWSFRDLGQAVVARDFFWTNAYAQIPRSAAAAARDQGIRVLLDGQFGDNLFDGPSLYPADLMIRREWRLLWSLLRREGSLGRGGRVCWSHGLRPLAPAPLRRLYRRWRGPQPTPFIGEGARLHALRSQAAEQAWARCGTLPASRRPRCLSLLSPFWPQGMAAVRGFPYAQNGIEVTSPYFDRRLVEFILAIPQEQIARPGESRRLQRLAMRRLLPEAVWQRKAKTDFYPLFHQGLFENEWPRIKAILGERPRIVRDGWIDGQWLATRLQNARGDKAAAYELSLCVHLELWLAAVEDARTFGGWSRPWQWGA